MDSINSGIEITVLYSIVTDRALDVQLDKIHFHINNIQQVCIQLNTLSNLKIKGIFGCQKNVEKEIQNEFKKEIDLTELLQQSEKGNLIVIKLSDVLLFCLILPISFFTKRPIQEKSIEIVLFRILHDFTDSIKLCLDEIVFTNWYHGDLIPFNAQSLVRRDYDFAEFNNQDIQIYQCQYSGLQNDIGSWQIINSQSTIPQIYIIKRLEKIKIEDLYSTFNSFTQALLIQIITKQNHCIIPLINSFKKEHQSDKIRTLLNELSLKLNEEIKEQRKTLVQKIFKELQRWFIGRIFQDNSKQPKAEEIVQSIFQSVEFIENQQLPFKFPDSQEYQKYTKQFNEHFGIINKQFKQIQGEFKNLIDELYFELCQQSMYSKLSQ
ncbi:unnamed protein product [Paramecium octaurelia]|uniref:Uncharacterized protein n=1 Tax=Paramecium octaurelia TaxID=43137 RepID=A0A8S1S3D5_PAROT|nr:unnamed protein product [Paramecium octaurelia]